MTSLYSFVCRAAVLLDPEDTSTWEELTALMPYLRRCLGCCACGCLLKDATVAAQCGHSFCQGCGQEGAEPVLRITCRQCRKRDNLVPDKQMRTIVACYKALCALVHTYMCHIDIDVAVQHYTRGIVGALVAETVKGASLSSLTLLPRINFPPASVYHDAERRREAVARQVAELETQRQQNCCIKDH